MSEPTTAPLTETGDLYADNNPIALYRTEKAAALKRLEASRVDPCIVGPSSAHGAGDEAVGMTAIVLPWAVLVGDNARHGVIKGRILLTSRYREALSAASMLATGQWRPREPIMGAVHLAVTFHEPDKRRRDIGNYTKLIADALTAVAYDDDSQIDRLTLVRGALDRVNPRAEITVESR